MAQFVTPTFIREPVTVGVLPTTIVPITRLRGSEEHIVELINDGVEAISPTIEGSIDGTAPFATIPDAAFEAMAVGEARFARIPSAWQFYRVRGAFPTTPGDMRYSIVEQKSFAHR